MRRRRRQTEEKVNHDRWLVSYADFITLLFAFFVVMYSVSQVSESKYRALSETLSNTFKSRGPVSEETVPRADSVQADMQQLAAGLREALGELIAERRVSVQATEEWMEITVNAGFLFPSASAQPNAEARELLAEIAGLLAPYQNAVDVSGHTDDRPIETAQFANNWELSAARATAVVALLSEAGIAPARLSATGYGEFRPVADNSTESGRAANRRVTLRVARHQFASSQVGSELLEAVLTGEATASPTTDSSEIPLEVPQTAVPEVEKPADRTPLKPIVREDGSLLFSNDPERSQSANQQ